MEHTPGPWRVVCGSACAVETAESPPRRICSLSYASHAVSARIPNEETLANADLVAAAPDMAQALRELVAEADVHPGWEGHSHPHSVGFELARAALVKAKVAA